ncbi:NUDIX domain-containing protein [Sphaerisporangium sp. NPDC051017]|uniref:NUDIX hydrolase n=1 Tax=Sphaerisporangium sp. NPDC051017 TaxID=3154636 RepID=UPI0034192184
MHTCLGRPALPAQRERPRLSAPAQPCRARRNRTPFRWGRGHRFGKGRTLLLRQAPGSAVPGLWEMPCGQVEEGESPEHAAERELREAAG